MLRRSAIGTAVALASLALLTAVMLPFRSHMSTATTGLVLVIPVVVGVVAGAFPAGVVSVVAGFVVYDYLFIPPYRTLSVGAAQNWVALGVYAVVLLLVARVVAGMDRARAEAHRQSREIGKLFELSDLLLADQPLDRLLAAVTTTLAEAFGCAQVAVFLPREGRLALAASTGRPLTADQLDRVLPAGGRLGAGGPAPMERDGLLLLALTAVGRPVGLLALSAEPAARAGRDPLLLFANHVALALERVQLREEALQTRLHEEVARLARTLVAAVAHDLRTPLASIKASSSTLADPGLHVDPGTARELARLVDAQADRLAALVANLLDMSRIQAGVLKPRSTVTPLPELVDSVLADLSPGLRGHPVHTEVPADLPPVDVDLVLISRVLANLLENAARHGPRDSAIYLRAERRGPDRVEVAVTDEGPGISPGRREEIFELFARRQGDSGAGLGLTLAKTFVEAHGQQIWVDGDGRGGTTFCFTLPVAGHVVEEPELVQSPHR